MVGRGATDRMPAWQWLAPALAAIVVCLPAWNGELIWDDHGLYLTANPLMRAADGPWRFWFTTECVDYYPLTYTLFWLQWQVVGAAPWLYHATNFLLHGIATALVVCLLHRLRVPLPWLVGLFFAVHPLQVETVAWISQQKTLLATACGYAALIAFDRHRASGRWPALAGAATLYALSLAAKPVFITLPPILFVWTALTATGNPLSQSGNQLASRSWSRAATITAHFFAIALFFGLVGIPFQLKGFAPDARGHDTVSRLASLGWTAWFYVWKTWWPFEPCFIYPRWRIDGWNPLHWLPNAGILAVALLLAGWRDRLGFRPLVCWGVYVVMMLPALGIVDVGFWQFSYVADHYVYQSLPALLVLAADLVRGLVALVRQQASVSVVGNRVGLAVALAAAALLAAVSWQRAAVYRTEAGLWLDTLAKNPAAEIASYQLAVADAAAGRLAQAEERYMQATAHGPRVARTWVRLGETRRSLEKWAAAREAYGQALALDERASRDRLTAAVGGAIAALATGDPAAALHLLENDVALHLDTVSLTPADRASLTARAAAYRHAALLARGDTEAAVACDASLARYLHRNPLAREQAARASDEARQPAAAAVIWATLAAEDPTFLANLAASLIAAGQTDDAVNAFLEAARRFPDDPGMVANAARALAIAGRPKEAVPLFEQALERGRTAGIDPTTLTRWAEERARAATAVGKTAP
jgi:protein O-mannosyl-transferase